MRNSFGNYYETLEAASNSIQAFFPKFCAPYTRPLGTPPSRRRGEHEDLATKAQVPYCMRYASCVSRYVHLVTHEMYISCTTHLLSFSLSNRVQCEKELCSNSCSKEVERKGTKRLIYRQFVTIQDLYADNLSEICQWQIFCAFQSVMKLIK